MRFPVCVGSGKASALRGSGKHRLYPLKGLSQQPDATICGVTRKYQKTVMRFLNLRPKKKQPALDEEMNAVRFLPTAHYKTRRI